jgi:signal transduction histidine kinase
MKLSYLILTGFLLILILFSTTTYINYVQSQEVNENSERFSRSSTILRHSNRFQRNFLNMVSGLRGYMLTNEAFFMQSYDSAHAENREILAELATLIPDSSRQGVLFNQIRQLNDRWINELAAPLIKAKKESLLSDSARIVYEELSHDRSKGVHENLIQQGLQRRFREFSNNEYAYREAQREILTASVQHTSKLSFYLTGVSIILGIGIALFLATHISSRLGKMIRMADRIAQGDYAVSVEHEGSDEVGQLERSLNRMAHDLAENIKLLQSKNEELNQFAHIVSHDIKAPLRGIDNVVTWIEEDYLKELPPKVQEYIGLIKGRVVRAENMLNGILSYSRIGREVQHKEVVHVSEMLEEIREYLPDRSPVTLRIQPGMPHLFTERIPLFQVFSNLIINAFKYHDKKDGIVKVYFKSFDNYYEFFVEDNGPGIAAPYHGRIFMIFQTLQERDAFESTGVGLAIVKKILDDRKQTIRLDSEPGKGSTFIFTWPKTEPL